MKTKSFTKGLVGCALLAASLATGCKEYDDTGIRKDIADLQGRVESLEAWCETAKGQISALQNLVAAVESRDYITGVEPITEAGKETGYAISLGSGKTFTVKHGTQGDPGVTPQIGVAKDEANPSDENYYWTVKTGDGAPEFIVDPATGGKMAVTGEKGDTPELSVEEDNGRLYWKVDGDWLLSGGAKVPATGEQGDAIFAENGVDCTSDPDNVTFTLANGTTLTVPRTRTMTVGFDSYEVFILTPAANVIDIVLPKTLKEEDYTALVAEVKNEAGTGMDIQTRAVSSPWQVELTKPSFVDGVYQNDAKATVTATGANNGDRAILKITLIDGKGQEISVSRVLEYFNGVIVDVQAGGLSAALTGTTPADITGLKVSGTLNEADFEYIRKNLTALEVLDLSGSDITELPERALAFYSSMGLTDNITLKEVVLPERLTTIGNSAFAMCTALEKLNIPSTVTTFGRWILEGAAVKSVTIPAGVTEIPASCFYKSAITAVEIPSSVQTIGDWAFQDTKLSEVVIPSSVTSIGEWTFGSESGTPTLQSVTIEADINEIPECCFYLQRNLTSLSLPERIVSIGADAFNQCKIASLTLPSSLEVIGARAFSNNGITQLTIPDKVTTIANAAFNSNNIAVIDLPASIASIHATAFDWESATTVICRAATVPQTPQTDENNNSWSPFYQVKENCVLKVPAGSLVDYQTAWGSYFNHIEAIE